MSPSCQTPEEKGPSPDWVERRRNFPAYKAHGYKLRWIDTTGSIVHLVAREVARLQQRDTSMWYLQGNVHAMRLNSRGETLENLQSQEAQVFLDRGIFIAQKDVRLSGVKGLRLETDHLVWDQQRQLMIATGWVRIYTAQETLRGEGLEYHTHLHTYRLRRTRGVVTVPSL
ncbi:MAG: hypothetical protein RMK19_03645 [Bacteroidia bacterium]|nr:hypothetical protein [Bacteroidia bacterium]MDW8015084.1 hypothetical protein [Bacteroidia bacterium]